MKTLRSAAVAFALLAAAGCGNADKSPSPAAPTANPTSATGGTSSSTSPRCAELFSAGQKIDQAKAAGGTCLDPAGGTQAVGSFDCKDGRHLWQVNVTGLPSGWGYGDDVYHASGNVDSDPDYGKAY